MNLHAAVQMYLRHHRAEGNRPKTLTWHQQSLGLFTDEVGSDMPVESLSANQLRSFIERQRERSLSQSTVQTRVRSIKAFGRWLAEEEVVPADPFRRVKRPKIDDTPQETLTPAQVNDLLASCKREGVVGQRDYAVMLLLFSTGLRASELVNIALDDLDLSTGLLTVRKGKGGRMRLVPLGREVQRAILQYMQKATVAPDGWLFPGRDGGHWSTISLASMLRRKGQALGIHCNPHKWRHTAAVSYLRAGGRIDTLKAMLGHSTMDLTVHYARLAGIDLVEQHIKADPVRLL